MPDFIHQSQLKESPPTHHWIGGSTEMTRKRPVISKKVATEVWPMVVMLATACYA